jgi:[ribosomal protein S5]-alanine N-acetyltransferase
MIPAQSSVTAAGIQAAFPLLVLEGHQRGLIRRRKSECADPAHSASIVTMDLATPRLLIRDLQADDLAAMTELWTDADVGHFMGTYGPRSAKETARWLEDTMQHIRAWPRFAHNAAIILAQTSERAGWIGCGKSSPPVGEYDFGYALRPLYRGHGYAREALTAVLTFCLGELGVSSVWGECNACNHQSAAVMRAAGMHPVDSSAHGDLRFRADHSWCPAASQTPAT